MNPWLASDVIKVKRLAADGSSGSEIAAHFEGRSRNAVMGLCHRLGIKLKCGTGSVAVSDSRHKKVRGGKPKKIAKPRLALLPRSGKAEASGLVPLNASAPLNLTLLELRDGQCKFAVSDAPFRFCGHQTGSPLVSWCPHHCERVFACQPVQEAA